MEIDNSAWKQWWKYNLQSFEERAGFARADEFEKMLDVSWKYMKTDRKRAKI